MVSTRQVSLSVGIKVGALGVVVIIIILLVGEMARVWVPNLCNIPRPVPGQVD